MKKVFLIIKLVVILSIIISCSSDDDSQSDPLVGTWKLIEFTSNGRTTILEGCVTETTYEFKENGTFLIQVYNENIDNNCVIIDTSNGEWNNKNGNIYEFKADSSDTFTEAEVVFTGDTFILEDEFSISKFQKT